MTLRTSDETLKELERMEKLAFAHELASEMKRARFQIACNLSDLLHDIAEMKMEVQRLEDVLANDETAPAIRLSRTIAKRLHLAGHIGRSMIDPWDDWIGCALAPATAGESGKSDEGDGR